MKRTLRFVLHSGIVFWLCYSVSVVVFALISTLVSLWFGFTSALIAGFVSGAGVFVVSLAYMYATGRLFKRD